MAGGAAGVIKGHTYIYIYIYISGLSRIHRAWHPRYVEYGPADHFKGFWVFSLVLRFTW